MRDDPEPIVARTETPEPPKGALFAIFLIVLSDMIGWGLLIPLLPFYARAYNASDLQVGLIFAIFSACQLIASPILGVLSDRFGRRPILLISQLGSILGYLLLAIATWNIWTNPMWGLALIYISRAIDGLSGGNISTAQAYISDVTTPENRAKGMGLLGAAFGIGFSIGPAIGGMLGHLHPALPALCAAGFCSIALVQTWARLKESRHQSATEAEAILHPSRFKPIFQSPVLLQLQLIGFFAMNAFVMLEVTFAMFLADTFKFGPTVVGWFFGFAGLVIVIVQGGLIGKLTRRFGEWRLAITGSILVAIAMAGYVQVAWTQWVWLVILAGLVNATGRSFLGPVMSSLMSKHSDRSQQGTVFGFYFMLSSLARVIGPVVAGASYTRHHVAPFCIAGVIMLLIGLWTSALRAQAAAGERRGFEPVVSTESLTP